MAKETLQEAAEHNYPGGDVWTEEQALIRRLAFKKGAEWQAERMFSEEDMFKMFIYGNSLKMAIERNAIENKPMGDIFNDFIQSLQQTEWDVEIEMENIPYSKELSESEVRGFEEHAPKVDKPKLDADGCLILKRK